MPPFNISNQIAKSETQTQAQNEGKSTMEISELPKHLFTPSDARSVDWARLIVVPANTVTPIVLMEYTVKESFLLQLTHYAVSNDSLLTSESWFLPTINGSRILPFHGDPMDNMKISLGRTTDLGNQALIPCNIQLRTGDNIKFEVLNKALVDATMGVRLVGWIDNSIKRTSKNFGG